MIETIPNCFDSHVHLLATGQVANELKLNDLKSISDLSQLIITEKNFRGNWLVGFGWDQNKWTDSKYPNKQQLDHYFPDVPVFFSRVDGHTSWINSKGIEELQKLGFDFSKDIAGGEILRNSKTGEPTGILKDQAHIHALLKLPAHSEKQIEFFLTSAGDIFNRGGFTHVRDLSMSFQQWQIQSELVKSGQMHLYCESFVTIESVEDFERGYAEYLKCVNHPSEYLKIKGLKIFVDGSLGSETAYLSQKYIGSNTQGILCWPPHDIKKVIELCWNKKIEIAIHTIGDEAAHTVALIAREISAAGLIGKIHLEHGQLLRPDTIQILKPLHVLIHMQPCHWLSDHQWLENKVGSLKQYLFPWELIRKNKMHFDFGSDSPIEPSMLLRNKEALDLSAKYGIPSLGDDWKKYHGYPVSPMGKTWGQCETRFDQNKIISVKFNQKIIIES